jgi:AcrR family transcriptional regulator
MVTTSLRVNVVNIKVPRSYTMTARADSAARTAESILDATRALFLDKVIAEITLADIAARSGVTVQTVLRRFGDKDSVFAAAVSRFGDEVRAQRGAAVPDTLGAVVANLVEHYEDWGRLMLKMMAEETGTAAIRDTVAAGKDYHRTWCETVFADALTPLDAADRARRLGQLVAICDLRTWELLRIGSGMSRQQTQLALHEMIEPLITKA